MDSRTSLKGRCHCGALQFVFVTRLPIENLPVRTCSCGFCAKVAPRYTSDPTGKVRFRFKPEQLSSYDSDRTTRRLICKKCGVYLGTSLTVDGRTYAVLNINTFDEAAKFAQPAVMMDFSNEKPSERRKRQMAKWIPVTTKPSKF